VVRATNKSLLNLGSMFNHEDERLRKLDRVRSTNDKV